MANKRRGKKSIKQEPLKDSDASNCNQNKNYKSLLLMLLIALLSYSTFQNYSLKSQLAVSNEIVEKSQKYLQLEPRTSNFDWVYENERKIENLQNSLMLDEQDPEVVAKIEQYERYLDQDGFSEQWRVYLNDHTPDLFQHRENTIDCRDLDQITISEDELLPQNFSQKVVDRAVALLHECGYVVLENLYSRGYMEEFKHAFDQFKETEEAQSVFRYPCQGVGRVEHLVPFQNPFNDSLALYTNKQLQDITFNFLHGQFKLELITVIDSTPGSGNQRWHQGWRYLFHPEERLPPYAIVVGVPLVNVSKQMGPTQFCPRKKMRFYQGYRCAEKPFSVPSSLGSVLIFDYKTLHRGPQNDGVISRPMVSMVFSKMFFMNTEAITNRGIDMAQTLHQRRYWEQFIKHPDPGSYFRV
eukprot:TRINITY_DN9829_c0_g1_i1.p1 TRINITY_DN9829_c0_g1~~TRINITY_DN9829_c0_g1_i1.p1  ORF type:complete len:412 (-),score=52.49 TRINITY_DN9829_c0_g1_i1:136-1371(-)